MKLSKISLLQLSKAEMERREQNMLRGGNSVFVCVCGCRTKCGCMYAGPQEGPNDPYYGGVCTENTSVVDDGFLSDETSGRSIEKSEEEYWEYIYFLD